MKILFITATRVGDAVLSTGLLSHLIGQYPKARFTIATGPAALSLFEAVPNLEELISMEKSILERHWFELWRRCIGTRWDIVVDLRRSAIAWLLHSGKRYRIPKLGGAVHRVELLGATLGLRDDPPAPTLWTNGRHREAAKRLFPPGTPVLAIAPVANWRGKQWRAERFAELAVRLTRPDGLLPGARVAVFASEHERQQAVPVLSALPEDRVIDTIGKIDLPTVAACLHRCALFIGNDSGLMHMAAASDVPTLGLFGPSRTEHYAPWGRHAAAIRTPESYEELTGTPGFDHRTTKTLMDGLSIEQVEIAAETLWAQTGATNGRLERRADGNRDGDIVGAERRNGMAAQLRRLSALVVAHNEEAQLAECLDTLSFADELVVVLDKSTDDSRAIAAKYTDKLIEGSWEIEGERRNTGIEACTGDWILEVDADERVPASLATEIRETLKSCTDGYFLVPFDNYVGERRVQYGWGAAWGVSAAPRFFRKGFKRWGNQRIHPRLDLKGPERRLQNSMVHYVDQNISDMVQRLDRYTTARAIDLRQSGNIGSFGHNFGRIFLRFFKCYIGRKGYREGHYGFLIALFAGLYPMLSYLKARLENE